VKDYVGTSKIMPALRNPRHEAFAQAIFRGIFEPDLYPTRGTAYRAAGYRASGLREPGGSAEVNASRLLKNAKILDRVRELQAEAAQEVKETIDKCVAELNEDRRDAKAQGQHSAAISAVMGKAKLLGLVTDKHEDVTSKPDFTKATSLQDVGLKLLQAVGYESPSSDDIALALEAHATMIAQLEAIAERAQSVNAEQ
jgi:hypothetical protein